MDYHLLRPRNNLLATSSSFSSSSSNRQQQQLQSRHFTFDPIPPMGSRAVAADPFSSPQQHQQEQQVQVVRNVQQINLAASFPAPNLTAAGRQRGNNGGAGLLQYVNPHSEIAPRVLQAHHRLAGRAEQSYKTVMCQNWLANAECHFGSKCRFAHGEEELRDSTVPLPINSKYKTRPCDKYTRDGICPYGQRCLFIHPDLDKLQSSTATASPASQQMLLHRQQMPLRTSAIENASFVGMGQLQQSQPLSLSGRISFGTSLPLSLTSYHRQRSSAATTTRNRNLLPHIQEELRREKEEMQQQQLGQIGDRRVVNSAALMQGPSSSSSITEQHQHLGRLDVYGMEDLMADMVAKLTSTPSAFSSETTTKKHEEEERDGGTD